MDYLLTILLAATALVVALYFLAPTGVAAAARRASRRLCGLATRSIQIEGIDWPYLEGGPRDGEALVLVHGFCADKDHWTLYARAFTRRYRVIIPDLPGFGDNTRDPALGYSTPDQTKRLHAFLGALGIRRCHLAGNSMGGFIALQYALAYPQALFSLAVFNGAGVTSRTKSELEVMAEAGGSPFRIETVQDVDRLLALATWRKVPMPRVMRRAAAIEFGASRVFHEGLFQSLIDEIRNRPLDDALGQVAVATLILWGRHDRLVDVSCACVLAETVPGSRLVILEDVGHLPMLEAPRVTAGHHLAFLQENSEGRVPSGAQPLSSSR